VDNFELNLGRACNSRCTFCVSRQATAAERAWLPLDKALHELELARAQGCSSLGLLGGEPTRYPHLLELVGHGRQLGYTRIALGTNGMRLADRAFLERLVSAGVTRVGVSIHADIASIEDRLTRTPGSFARKVAALRNLVAVRQAGGLPDGLAVNPVLHRRILVRLPRLLAFFGSLGLVDVRINSLRPVTLGREDRSLCPRFSEAQPRLLEIVAQNERDRRLHLTLGDFPFCVLPWQLLESRELLERYVGEQHDLATRVSIFSDARSEHGQGLARFSWGQAKRDRLKAKPAACAECTWEAGCEGFWKSYLDLWGEAEAHSLTSRPPPWAAGPGTV